MNRISASSPAAIESGAGMVILIALIGYNSLMRSKGPRRGIFASKSGFAFLMTSLLLAGLLVASCKWCLRLSQGSFHAFLTSGSIQWIYAKNVIFSDPPPVSILTFQWSLPEMWPEYESNGIVQTNFTIYRGMLPIWMLIVPPSFLSWFFYRRARRKRLIGRCPKCEYDLTGNTSGVCPECGKLIEAST